MNKLFVVKNTTLIMRKTKTQCVLMLLFILVLICWHHQIRFFCGISLLLLKTNFNYE